MSDSLWPHESQHARPPCPSPTCLLFYDLEQLEKIRESKGSGREWAVKQRVLATNPTLLLPHRWGFNSSAPQFPLLSSECEILTSTISLRISLTSEPVKLLSHVRLFAIPWTVAYQSPPPMEFSRQEYWSGLPFPTPGDLPDPEMEPRSPTLQADALSPELPGKQFSSTFYGYMVDFQKKMCIIITTIIIVRSIIIIISIISLTKWNVPGINSQTILWKEMKGRHL